MNEIAKKVAEEKFVEMESSFQYFLENEASLMCFTTAHERFIYWLLGWNCSCILTGSEDYQIDTDYYHEKASETLKRYLSKVNNK